MPGIYSGFAQRILSQNSCYYKWLLHYSFGRPNKTTYTVKHNCQHLTVVIKVSEHYNVTTVYFWSLAVAMSLSVIITSLLKVLLADFITTFHLTTLNIPVARSPFLHLQSPKCTLQHMCHISKVSFILQYYIRTTHTITFRTSSEYITHKNITSSPEPCRIPLD